MTYLIEANKNLIVYTIAQAKSMLSQLVKQAGNGKGIIIVRGNVPVARLLPINHRKHRKPGSMKGLLKARKGAFDPLTAKELNLLGFE